MKLIWKIPEANTQGQDIFLYAVIIPVIPFSLTNRADIQPDKGKTMVNSSMTRIGISMKWYYQQPNEANRVDESNGQTLSIMFEMGEIG